MCGKRFCVAQFAPLELLTTSRNVCRSRPALRAATIVSADAVRLMPFRKLFSSFDDGGDGPGRVAARALELRRIAVVAGDRVTGGEDAPRDPAAHVPDPDDPDPLPRQGAAPYRMPVIRSSRCRASSAARARSRREGFPTHPAQE